MCFVYVAADFEADQDANNPSDDDERASGLRPSFSFLVLSDALVLQVGARAFQISSSVRKNVRRLPGSLLTYLFSGLMTAMENAPDKLDWEDIAKRFLERRGRAQPEAEPRPLEVHGRGAQKALPYLDGQATHRSAPG
jgi:hypothetical protein